MSAPFAWAQNPASPGASSRQQAALGNIAAKIVLAQGEVTVLGADNQARRVKAGELIREGESIVTGKDGELHMRMEDGGYIAVRPNTRMNISQYQANGSASDRGIFGLISGSFRSITGWIGKFNRDRYLVRTSSATIGIRGTDHEPLVIPAGSNEGPPGTFDKVNAGGTFLMNDAGRADVAPGQAGFASPDRKSSPRVLDSVPAFFRTTPNEFLLDGKHDAVQNSLDQLREQRRADPAQSSQTGSNQAPSRSMTKVNVQNITQSQTGLINKQEINIGNAVKGSITDVTAKGVTQNQSGMLNQQKMNIGNAQ
jgi:hypothetical protein